MRLKNGFGKTMVYAFSVMLLFAALMTAASCRKDETAKTDSNSANTDQTADADYSKWSSLAARSESTLYYLNHAFGSADYLLYTDLEAHVSGYVCGKPECTHSDENCNAWLGSRGCVSNLFVYDQHIYWAVNDLANDAVMWLYRMELNGEKHERVLQLTFSMTDDEELYPTENAALQMHQGILYAFGRDERLVDGEMFRYSQITAYDITSGKYETVYKGEDHPHALGYGFNAQCSGDNIWYLDYYDGANGPKETSYLRICRYNIPGKSSEVIYEGAYPDTSFEISSIYVSQNDVYFLTRGDGNRAELWRFDSGSKKLFLQYTIEYEVAAFITDGLVALYSLPDQDHIRLAFIDYQGEIVSDHVYSKGDISARTFMMAGFDREKLCLLFDDIETDMETAFVLIPTDGSNMQILWHEKR